MTDCIFCKIVANQIPANKIYEDDLAVAFMDVGPLVRGHALVIPKAHYESLLDVPADLLAHLSSVVQRVAQAQLTGLGADGVNLHQANGPAAGQVVPHLHFHLVPRFRGDGHHWNWTPRPYADSAEPAALAQRIRDAMQT
jgi:histidine triad (HIT) family protein